MRADLLALTPEAIAALANVGLVKRAQKELEQGKGPRIEEAADGTVVGHFDDGVVARLPPGMTLRECLCTCVASGVCRHRVAVALAYRAFASDATSAPATPASPADIDDAALERLLPKRTLDDARAIARRGMVIEVIQAAGTEPPTARLAACTVRFFGAANPEHARCDCATGQGCVHIALAVWAFRGADPHRASQVIDLRPTRAPRHDAADTEALALVEDVLAAGVVNAREALAQRFVLAREPLVAARQQWLVDVLDDFELALQRYRARSARYRASDVLVLAAELVARGRAARAPHAELPPSVVLGEGEAAETKLDRLRLLALGCRFDADGDTRSVEILFADPDTGTVLVLDKTWSFDPGEAPPDAPTLARRTLGPGPIHLLAKGQIVTRVAKRRANRVLALGQGAHGATSLAPQTGDFDLLPRPLRVDRLAELEATFAARAPRLVRARVRAEDVHVFRVGGIDGVYYDAGAQVLVAHVRDPDGRAFVVRRDHRRVAPRAVDELGRALSGSYGAVRWIAGATRIEGRTFIVDPSLVSADRVVVPDVEDTTPTDLPRGRAPSSTDVIGQRLDAAWSLLEEVTQLGVRGTTPTFAARCHASIADLRSYGLARLADHLERAADHLSRNGRAPLGDPRPALRAVLDAAIALDLAREGHR